MRSVRGVAANDTWQQLLEALPEDARIGFVTERYAKPSARLASVLDGLAGLGILPALATEWPGSHVEDVEDAVPLVLAPPEPAVIQLLLSTYPRPLLASRLASGEPRDWHLIGPGGSVWLGSNDCDLDVWVASSPGDGPAGRLLSTLPGT